MIGSIGVGVRFCVGGVPSLRPIVLARRTRSAAADPELSHLHRPVG